jgi:hypothetical protein
MSIPNATAGLVYYQNLMIGLDELQWLQDEKSRLERAARLSALMSHGLQVRRKMGGDFSAEWAVDDADDDGKISVRVGQPYTGSADATNQAYDTGAVDVEGYEIRLESDLDNIVTVPNDSTWYTVVVQRLASLYERGTIAVSTGSAVVVGTGTEFKRLSGYTTSGYSRGSRIFIKTGDSGHGNAGTYEVDTITDDTHLTLRTVVAGTNEAGLKFGIAGNFATSPPAEPRIHQRLTPSVTLVPRARAVAAPALILADVMRNDLDTPKVTVIDRREANIYREIPSTAHGVDVRPLVSFDTSSPYTATKLDRSQAKATGGSDCDVPCASPASDNTILMACQSGTSIHARIYRPNPGTGGVFWNDPGASPTVIDATTSASQPALVQLPMNADATHLCVYTKAGGTLEIRSSTDDGGTWSAATTLLDPTGLDAGNIASRPSLLLMRNGRLICACEYFDQTLDAAVGRWCIRYVYSDDYGLTWNTNSEAAFNILSISLPGLRDCRRPCIVQDAASGQVWTVYEYTAVGTDGDLIRALPGGIDSPTPTVTDPSGGSPLGGVAGKQMTPCAWVSPGGQLCVFYTSWTLNVLLAVSMTVLGLKPYDNGIVVGSIVYTRELFRVFSSGTVAQDRLWPCVVQNRGVLHMLFKNSVPADTAIDWVPCDVIDLPLNAHARLG